MTKGSQSIVRVLAVDPTSASDSTLCAMVNRGYNELVLIQRLDVLFFGGCIALSFQTLMLWSMYPDVRASK